MTSGINSGLHVDTTERTFHTQEVTGSSPVSPTIVLGTKKPLDAMPAGFVLSVLHTLLHSFIQIMAQNLLFLRLGQTPSLLPFEELA